MVEMLHQGYKHKLLGNRLRAPVLEYSMDVSNSTPHLMSLTICVILGCARQYLLWLRWEHCFEEHWMANAHLDHLEAPFSNAPRYQGNQQTTVSMDLLPPTFDNSALARHPTQGHIEPQKWQAAIHHHFERPLVSLGLTSLNLEKNY